MTFSSLILASILVSHISLSVRLTLLGHMLQSCAVFLIFTLVLHEARRDVLAEKLLCCALKRSMHGIFLIDLKTEGFWESEYCQS